MDKNAELNGSDTDDFEEIRERLGVPKAEQERPTGRHVGREPGSRISKQLDLYQTSSKSGVRGESGQVDAAHLEID